MWKKAVKWSLLGVMLAYVVFMFVWGNAQAALHTCKGIEVEIHTSGMSAPLSEANVLEVVKNYPGKIKGVPVNAINSLEIADYLRQFNNFETVECVMTSQGNLRIKVVPMVPELRVFDKSGSYYVNKDGKTMTANHNFFVDVPVVSGDFNKNFQPVEVMPVVRYVKNDDFLRSLTAMIVARGKDDILLVPRISGHIINVGDTSRMDEKKRAILTAYRQIMPYKGWETYDTISVKFKGQIVATKRDKSAYAVPLQISDGIDLEEEALVAAHQDQPDDRSQTEE